MDNKFTNNVLEHAKSYWMMGWTWEEIATVLSDMGYESDEISEAIDVTQDYAYKVLNDGPFSVLKEGQLIKLKNENVVRILSMHKDFVNCDYDNEHICVCAEHINFEASKKLTTAFLLKVEVVDLLRKAQEQMNMTPPTEAPKPVTEQPAQTQEPSDVSTDKVPNYLPSSEEDTLDSQVNLEKTREFSLTPYTNSLHQLLLQLTKVEKSAKDSEDTVTEKTKIVKTLQLNNEETLRRLADLYSNQANIYKDLNINCKTLNESIAELQSSLEIETIPIQLKQDFDNLLSYTNDTFLSLVEQSFYNINIMEENNDSITASFNAKEFTKESYINIVNTIHTAYTSGMEALDTLKQLTPTIEMLISKFVSFNNTFNTKTTETRIMQSVGQLTKI